MLNKLNVHGVSKLPSNLCICIICSHILGISYDIINRYLYGTVNAILQWNHIYCEAVPARLRAPFVYPGA